MMQTERLTYAQLERLLTKLGYQQVPSVQDARVFVNAEYDAVSVLPCANGEELARLHHLITLRKIATEKGIVQEDTFNNLLNAVQQEAIEPLVKAS